MKIIQRMLLTALLITSIGGGCVWAGLFTDNPLASLNRRPNLQQLQAKLKEAQLILSAGQPSRATDPEQLVRRAQMQIMRNVESGSSLLQLATGTLSTIQDIPREMFMPTSSRCPIAELRLSEFEERDTIMHQAISELRKLHISGAAVLPHSHVITDSEIIGMLFRDLIIHLGFDDRLH